MGKLNFNASLSQCYLDDFSSDLKIDNIVLTRNGQVRLVDFGLASNLQDGKLKLLYCDRYAAPEVWDKKPAGLPSDWWSFGCTVAYFIQLRHPFLRSTIEKTRQMADAGNPYLFETFPNEMKEFIMRFLRVNPEERPSNASSDEIFKNLTQTPFIPGDVKLAPVKPKEGGKYFTDLQHVYEIFESSAVRIPPGDFFKSDYFKAI